ncbi:MAG: glycosyl hydrolase family 28-related protein, partial [Bacteroidia bacterium]|nr:glycosyl hydrolase family 28-related protein [Bacteroidia bacterium]
MRLLNFGNTSLILAVILSACNQAGNVNPPAPSRGQQKVPETFSISEPQISDNTVSIIDFGAVSDGQTLNTKAIADAIDKVSRKGGGKVIIPRGLWLTGPIILKSNINIHI